MCVVTEYGSEQLLAERRVTIKIRKIKMKVERKEMREEVGMNQGYNRIR
jgi:hypothetical protein